MRVATYTRVSRASKTDDPLQRKIQDTENQSRQLREYITNSKWTLVHEYKDEKSGKSSDRPEFQRMFEDARLKKFDLLLFWSLDRLSREGATETLNHLRQLDIYGIEWKSYTEQYLDSCGLFKEAVMAILAVIAKQERIRFVERTVSGQEKYKEEFARGRAKSRSGKNKAIGRPHRILDKVILKDMREIQGLSIRQIAKALGASHMTIYRTLREQ